MDKEKLTEIVINSVIGAREYANIDYESTIKKLQKIKKEMANIDSKEKSKGKYVIPYSPELKIWTMRESIIAQQYLINLCKYYENPEVNKVNLKHIKNHLVELYSLSCDPELFSYEDMESPKWRFKKDSDTKPRWLSKNMVLIGLVLSYAGTYCLAQTIAYPLAIISGAVAFSFTLFGAAMGISKLKSKRDHKNLADFCNETDRTIGQELLSVELDELEAILLDKDNRRVIEQYL